MSDGLTKRPDESQTEFTIRCIKAEAWDEGHAASERDWQLTFDLSTPDEDRQPLTNPYRGGE